MDLANIAWVASLTLMLAACCWHDAVERRIPNRIVFAGAILALAIATTPSGRGALVATGGLAAGLGAGLVLHLARVMAAGDAKLLAAVGAYVGFPDILLVLVYTLVAGGVLALAYALSHGRLRAALASVAGVLRFGGAVPSSRDRIPYALAVAAGTAAHLALGGALAWRFP